MTKFSEKLTRLERIFKKMDESNVVIGVIGGTHTDENGNTFGMADLAAVHEFGSEDGNIPERSFLRASLDSNRKLYQRQVAALLKQAVNGQIPETQIYGTVGAIAAGKAQEVIMKSEGITPLKPETIRRKGSSKPLIDTGQLVQSITWDVRND